MNFVFAFLAGAAVFLLYQIFGALEHIASALLEIASIRPNHFADAGKMMEKAREEYKREATLNALNLEADK